LDRTHPGIRWIEQLKSDAYKTLLLSTIAKKKKKKEVNDHLKEWGEVRLTLAEAKRTNLRFVVER
jgi:CelD/BcsL family acetyltransferase involved in cellulose biosynthesis